MSYPPGQKPPQWSIDSGIVAYNASRLGLPMPIGLWAMWEKGGGKIYDLSGQNNNGTLAGTTTWEKEGLLFDEDNEYVDVAQYTEFNDKASIFFIYENTVSEYYSHLWDHGATDIHLILRHHSNNFSFYNNSNKIIDIGPLSDLKKRLFSCGWNIGDNYSFLQVDDTFVESSAVLSAITLSSALRIGNRVANSTREATGVISLFYIFNEVLTDQQRQSLHTNPYGLIADPYQIETLGFVAAAGGLSIPVVMHHYQHNLGR